MFVYGCHNIHGLFTAEADVFKVVLVFESGKGCYLSVPLFHLQGKGVFLLLIAGDYILSRAGLEQGEDLLVQFLPGYQWCLVKIIANFCCQRIGRIE